MLTECEQYEWDYKLVWQLQLSKMSESKKKKYAPLNDEHMHAEHGQSLACWRNMVWQSTCDLKIRVFPCTAVIEWVLSM